MPSVPVFLLTALLVFSQGSALAQPIIAAQDGTGTQVTASAQNPHQHDIHGGTRAGANLFHSLEKFGVPTGQIANFLSNANIQNILGRVVGGDPSLINGLIKVTGGNSNLYLLNPAGIVFGQHARLDVPGSFIATTAKGVQIGEEWFKAVGSNNYEKLVGPPGGFGFTGEGAGAIVNQGELEVSHGKQIALVGGQVVNTGKLKAPGGTITIAAVAGEKLVRVSQEGNVLSLDLPVAAKETLASEAQPLKPASLPELLTGGEIEEAAGVVVENGIVKLTASNTPVPDEPGVAIVSGTIDVSNAGVETTESPALGGKINVLGEKVGVVGADIDASGREGGGTVLVGGDYKGQGQTPKAQQTYVSQDSSIRADALDTGDGGKVIVWADENTAFHGDISARGGETSGDGGFVEVSGKDDLQFWGNVALQSKHGSEGVLLLDPRSITVSNDPSSPGANNALPEFFANELPGQNVTINAGTLQNQVLGTLILEATDGITISDGISLNFTNAIRFNADADPDGAGPGLADGVGSFNMDTGQSITTSGNDLEISAAEITVGTLSTATPVAAVRGGDVTLTATAGNLTVGNIDASAVDLISANGDVTLTANNGAVTMGSIFDFATLISGASDIKIKSLGDISSVNLFATGNVSLTSATGGITAFGIRAFDDRAAGQNGQIDVVAEGNINITQAFPEVVNGNRVLTSVISDGSVSLTSKSGDIVVKSTVRSGENDSNGDIRIKAGKGFRVETAVVEPTTNPPDVTSSIIAISDNQEIDAMGKLIETQKGEVRIKVGNAPERIDIGKDGADGAQIDIEIGDSSFSIGPEIPPNPAPAANTSGTAGAIIIRGTNKIQISSFQNRLFTSTGNGGGTGGGTIGDGTGGGTIGDGTGGGPTGNGSGTGGGPRGNSVTLTAQTLDYDNEAGEQDSEEEECPPSDPACESDEAGLLDVSAVSPEVPTR